MGSDRGLCVPLRPLTLRRTRRRTAPRVRDAPALLDFPRFMGLMSRFSDASSSSRPGERRPQVTPRRLSANCSRARRPPLSRFRGLMSRRSHSSPSSRRGDRWPSVAARHPPVRRTCVENATFSRFMGLDHELCCPLCRRHGHGASTARSARAGCAPLSVRATPAVPHHEPPTRVPTRFALSHARHLPRSRLPRVAPLQRPVASPAHGLPRRGLQLASLAQ
jgi:hypothetical protein